MSAQTQKKTDKKNDTKTTKTLSTSSLSKVLYGDHVINQNGRKILLSEIAKNHECVAVYFSGSWCGPCKQFAPKFKERYIHWKSKGRCPYVIYVSADKSKDDFDKYFLLMHKDWTAIPFYDAERRKNISENLNKQQTIPTLIILNKNGEINSLTGRTIVQSDPNAVDFPWVNYEPPYKPPNPWARVLIRLALFGFFILYYQYYKKG